MPVTRMLRSTTIINIDIVIALYFLEVRAIFASQGGLFPYFFFQMSRGRVASSGWLGSDIVI